MGSGGAFPEKQKRKRKRKRSDPVKASKRLVFLTLTMASSARGRLRTMGLIAREDEWHQNSTIIGYMNMLKSVEGGEEGGIDVILSHSY